MAVSRKINIEIDKLTRSIENVVSGDSFKTEILPLSSKDIKTIKKKDWLFDWSSEAKIKDKTVYKLVIVNNPGIIQGLISLQDRGDPYFHASYRKQQGLIGVQEKYIWEFPGISLLLLVSYHSIKVMKAMSLLKVRQNSLTIIVKP